MEINDYEIRAVRENETDAMLSLMCICFGLSSEMAAPIFRADPFYDLAHKRVLIERDSGRILSCLTLLPAQIRLASSDEQRYLAVGGIAGVCTNPKIRGHGLASLLLNQTVIDASRELGFLATALTAERPDFYVKLGWKPSGTAYEWCAPSEFFNTDVVVNVDIHLALTDEQTRWADQVHELYDRCVSKVVAGAFLRSQSKWTAIETLTLGRRLLVALAGDTLVGYAAYDVRKSDVGLTAFVHEAVTVDEGLRHAMMSFFWRHRISDFVAGRSKLSEVTSLQLIGNPDIKLTEIPGAYIRCANEKTAREVEKVSPFLGVPDMF